MPVEIETKEIKVLDMELKAVGEDGVFTGYASFFGNVDYYGDIVKKGAFKKTIKESKGKIPILDHHSAIRQIGWNMEASEDETGLLVKGRLDLNVQAGKERHSLMKMALELKAKTGLSIGYRTIKWENDREDPAIRILTEVQLLEYSVVTFPANSLANVTNVKSRMNQLAVHLQCEFGIDEQKAIKAVETLMPLLETEPGKESHSEGKEAGPENMEPLKHSLKQLLKTIQS